MTRHQEKKETDMNAREKLEKTPAVTDWNRAGGDEGAILSGPLVRVVEDEHLRRDGGTYLKHMLVIADDHDGGKPKRVQVEGREFKAWFRANRQSLRPGVEVAVRFDGEETNDKDYTWRNYTVSPDTRDGDEFEFRGDPAAAAVEEQGRVFRGAGPGGPLFLPLGDRGTG